MEIKFNDESFNWEKNRESTERPRRRREWMELELAHIIPRQV